MSSSYVLVSSFRAKNLFDIRVCLIELFLNRLRLVLICDYVLLVFLDVIKISIEKELL